MQMGKCCLPAVERRSIRTFFCDVDPETAFCDAEPVPLFQKPAPQLPLDDSTVLPDASLGSTRGSAAFVSVLPVAPEMFIALAMPDTMPCALLAVVDSSVRSPLRRPWQSNQRQVITWMSDKHPQHAA